MESETCDLNNHFRGNLQNKKSPQKVLNNKNNNNNNNSFSNKNNNEITTTKTLTYYIQ